MHHTASLFTFVTLVGALVSQTLRDRSFLGLFPHHQGQQGPFSNTKADWQGTAHVPVNLFLCKAYRMHHHCAMRMLVHSRQTVLWLEPKQYQAWCCQQDSMDDCDNMDNHGDGVFQMVPFSGDSVQFIISDFLQESKVAPVLYIAVAAPLLTFLLQLASLKLREIIATESIKPNKYQVQSIDFLPPTELDRLKAYFCCHGLILNNGSNEYGFMSV